MPTPSLPAASLSPQLRFPARQVLLRMANDLICLALWSIRGAILRAEANFLPALREGGPPAEGQPTGKCATGHKIRLQIAGAGEHIGHRADRSSPDQRMTIGPLCGTLLQRELALDAVRGETLAGRGEALGGADMEPFAVVHDRAQAARRLGAVEEPDQ